MNDVSNLNINWKTRQVSVATEGQATISPSIGLVPYKDKYNITAAKVIGVVDQVLAPGVYKFQSGMALFFAGAQVALCDTAGNKTQKINPNGVTRVQPKGGQPFVIIAGNAGLTFLTPEIADVVDGLVNRPKHTPEGPNWWNNLPVMGWHDYKTFTDGGTPTGPYKHGGVATWAGWNIRADGSYFEDQGMFVYVPTGAYRFDPGTNRLATWDWINAPQIQAYQAAWHEGEQVLKLSADETRKGAVAAAREEHSRSGQAPYWYPGWDESGYIS